MEEMNKQLFLSGAIFQLKKNHSKYSVKYKYTSPKDEGDCGMIGEERILGGHICNIIKVGTRFAQGYTFILGKMIKIKLRFDELYLVETEKVG